MRAKGSEILSGKSVGDHFLHGVHRHGVEDAGSSQVVSALKLLYGLAGLRAGLAIGFARPDAEKLQGPLPDQVLGRVDDAL
ncbi:MAG: hypothetical protein NXI19_03500 [Alphaproteobacteria bacterium]|nr:hypothetical protein [Alphaproteobacteria bacterium]